MKNLVTFLTLFLLVGISGLAQVGINANNGAPDPSAMLDITSTTKGFLPPRMTTAQRDLISSPATGLTIYNITKLCNETYNGSIWVGKDHYIGESYGGGIVFYVYDNGQHGLIAATSDQSAGVQWYNGFNIYCNRIRNDGISIGRINTDSIIGKQGLGTYAAQICAQYLGGGFGDWYLPSKYELNLLYLQKDVVGGFTTGMYWSSSEYNANKNWAWYEYFGDGSQYNETKSDGHNVRAVRAF